MLKYILGMILISIEVLIILNQQMLVHGHIFTKSHFRLNIENALSEDVLDLRCTKYCGNKKTDLGLVHLALHQNYTTTFETTWMKNTKVKCSLGSVNNGRLLDFDACNEACGSYCEKYHCNWRVADDGLHEVFPHGYQPLLYCWNRNNLSTVC
ncbi:hypothetical protein RND81_07G142300 [Saponaria officinalis]|uniref:Uncharacterized protein n=1 Tax=Saponaria officinalis TaxID=3572 RepID=A0AAW1JSE5_SAPOF